MVPSEEVKKIVLELQSNCDKIIAQYEQKNKNL
jgi:hypothetical protein